MSNEELVKQIDWLLDSGEYRWAEHTLEAIKDTVESQEFPPTERQIEAVQNIEEGGRRYKTGRGRDGRR